MKGVTQPELIQFEVEYKVYEEQVSEVNRSRDASRRIKPSSIRNCCEPLLLQSLCILGQIEGATTLEEATDASVKKWLDERLASAPQDIAERVRSAVNSVQYCQCKEDPAGACLKFVLDVVAALDRNNASEVIKDKEMCKSLISKLIEKLEPPELRERIRDARECWTSDQKSDLGVFQSRASTVAVDVSQGELARARLKRRSGSTRSRESCADGEHPQRSMKRQKKVSRQTGRTLEHRKEQPYDPKKWDKPCLNPDCSGRHPMKECRNTSADKKRQFLKEYWDKKKISAKAVKVSSEIDKYRMPLPSAADGRYRVTLEDAVDAIALGDYGSDESAIPFSLLQEVLESEPNVLVVKLNTPTSLATAIKSTKPNPITFTASQTAQLSLTISLPGSNLPVRIRGIKFLVVDQKMDEVLLGRPFLRAIGFDLEKHLESVATMIDGKHIEELSPTRLKAVSIPYAGLVYQKTDDDPVELPHTVSAGIGSDSLESINNALAGICNEARTNGLSVEGHLRLTSMLRTHRDVFRIKLGADEPARVRPLAILPARNARPHRSPQRRYSPVQRVFLENTVRELEKVGAIYKNPAARWASPALAVPKPGSSTLRFTVDLRGPNSQTVPIQSAMPHLESLLQTTAGSVCFAKIDMAHAYWQLPLAQDSQEMLSIQTPLGVYSSTRLLQGSTDAGNHFQAVTQELFQEKVPRLLQWLDDFLLHADSEQQLLDSVDQFLGICAEHGLKIHAEKTELFLREARFCGRVLSRDGLKFDPRHFESLLQMQSPKMGGDLQQLLCATNWMRTSIPTYAETIAPLHNLMEKVYQNVGSRTKRAVSKISLTSLWGPPHDDAFATIKRQLAAATRLAHPKVGSELCLFTDASDTHWAAVLTQVPREDRRKAIDKQMHEPLCFLSGAFKGSSQNWSVPEKEGFAVVESLCRMDYLISGHIVTIFTDHANLVYLFDPYGRNPGVSRHTASKLMRWAIKLSAFRYVIEHLPGEENVWADMLTRWAVQDPTSKKAHHAKRLKALIVSPISPGLDARLDWPKRQDIILSQRNSAAKPKERFRVQNGCLMDNRDVVWICPRDRELQLRILVAAHCGMAGHRGWRATHSAISAHFWWESLQADTESFVKSCIHCLSTATGEKVPRPLGHAVHGSRPNEVLHFDFCYIMHSESAMRYVLILKDDFSGYTWLVPTSETDAETAANALLQWFASFGIARIWVSDQGSHFKNELVTKLCESLQSQHHFTLPYCPWSNGTVEVVCRELLRAMRALLSELQMPQRCWPQILPLVQSVLNNSILSRLGNRSPTTVFTGQSPESPLLSVKETQSTLTNIKTVSEARTRQLLKIRQLETAMQSMHRDVTLRVTKKREAAVISHNRRTGVREVNFTVGDYVLRGLVPRERRRKPSLKWRGPFRVTKCHSDYVFEIEDLLTGKRQDAHGRRLKFFRNKDFEVSEDVRNHIAYQENELLVIEDLEDIRKTADEVQLLVKWRGFESEENDWVSLPSLREDVPELVQEYLQTAAKEGTPRQRKIAQSLLH